MRRLSLVFGAVTLGLAGSVGVLVFGQRSGGGTSHPRQALPATARFDDYLAAADARHGADLFAACAACHSIGRSGADVDGPNLYGVVGSRVAERRPRYNYSAALRNAGGIWTTARLNAWLTNPGAFAPGTTMGFPGLPDPQDRADVIAYLAEQGLQPTH